MAELEKIYSVEFMEYTNALRDTVSSWDGKGLPKADEYDYLKVPSPFLIREGDLLKYKRFGQGYRSIHFVGYLEEE